MNRAAIVGGAVSLWAGSFALGATIHLSSPTGDTSMALTTTGDLQIRVTTAGVDTIRLAFLNAFLDTTGEGVDADSVDVAGVTAGNGVPWVYDRSAFEDEYPVELDESDHEYGLVSGDQTQPDGGYPLGEATYVHDTLHLINTNDVGVQGVVNVTFELGARAPNATGPGPMFYPFDIATPGFPHGFPNQLYIGDTTSTNTPFEINVVPEPSTTGLLSLAAAIAAGRRRSRGRR